MILSLSTRLSATSNYVKWVSKRKVKVLNTPTKTSSLCNGVKVFAFVTQVPRLRAGSRWFDMVVVLSVVDSGNWGWPLLSGDKIMLNKSATHNYENNNTGNNNRYTNTLTLHGLGSGHTHAEGASAARANQELVRVKVPVPTGPVDSGV